MPLCVVGASSVRRGPAAGHAGGGRTGKLNPGAGCGQTGKTEWTPAHDSLFLPLPYQSVMLLHPVIRISIIGLIIISRRPGHGDMA
jgi:hypothetical protein